MATNVDGRFEIKVNDDPNVMLVFSFIGMKSQEMKIGQATTLNVVLEPENKALEEVVVTGYQTISKERATGRSIKYPWRYSIHGLLPTFPICYKV